MGGRAQLGGAFLGDFFEGISPSARLVGGNGAVISIDEPIGAFVLLADEFLEDLAIAFLLGQEPSRVKCPGVLLRLLLQLMLFTLRVLLLEISEERRARL